MALLTDPLDALAGVSAAVVAVRERVRTVLARQFGARRPPPLLLRGETGTGKGLLARACHQAGPRAGGPFVTVNCAAIPESLIEAELFGFERGAFTDARQGKAGLFHSAGGGTIFMDEIGLLAEPLQAKLLTFLDDRVVRRLGSTRAEAIDLWVMAATSVDLETAVREGRFREDLYHRLAVLWIWLPPLREREGDILLLADLFLAQACRDYGLQQKTLTEDARSDLLAHPWPGNVRELANVMERAVLVSETVEIDGGVLALPGGRSAPPPGESAQAVRMQPHVASAPLSADYRTALDRLERAQLLEALEGTSWNISRAAELLGVPRNTLRYRMAKHQLERGGHSRRSRNESRGAGVAGELLDANKNTIAAPAGRLRPVTFLRVILTEPQALASPWVHSQGLDLVTEKIEVLGGSVLMRDAIGLYAAFGLEPAEDAPARAAGGALAVQRLVERAQLQHPAVSAVCAIDTLTCRIEEHSRQARLDAVALQEAQDTLSVLLEGAHGNVIVVGPDAAPYLERQFVLMKDGSSGTSRQLVRREKSEVEPHHPLPLRRGSPFVGRAQEVSFLEQRLRQVATTGGHIVGLMGEPGMGKSRLLDEFRRILTRQGVSILVGSCASHSTAVPYSLLVDLLRQTWRLDEMDTPDVLVATVKERLATIGLAEGVSEILALLGFPAEALAPLSPEAVRTRIFETLRRLVLAHARPAPLAVLLEDVHWADQTSQEFLGLLTDSLPGAPVLVVVTTRPGPRAPWLDRSWASQLALPPLSLKDSQQIVRTLRPEFSAVATDAVARRAEGNPFFLEELAWAAGASGRMDALPATVDAALTARMDRLPAATCQVLEAAAILGREVPGSFLPMVCEGIDLARPLAELVSLEFLYPWPGSGHVFKHALTHKAAYARLPATERERLHAIAATALEAAHAEHPDTVLDQLAYHWSRAQDHRKAVDYLGRVSERATAEYALAEAVVAVERALEHCDRLPPGDERDRLTIQALTRIVLPLALLGRLREARDRLAPYSPQVQRLADPWLSGPFFFAMALAHDHTGRHAEAAEVARLSLEASIATEDDLTAGRALAILSHSSLWGGTFRRGLAEGERAVMYLQRTSDVFWLGISHWIRGHHHLLLGDLSGALLAAAALISFGERTADRRFQSYGLCLQGWAQARIGDVGTGVRACVRAVDLAPDPLARSIVVGYLGELCEAAGDHDLARSHLQEAVAFLREANFPQVEAWHTARWAETERAARNPSGARELALRALDRARDIKFSYVAALAKRTLGRMAVIQNSQSDADAHHLLESLEIFEDVEAGYDAAVTRLDLADLCEALGQAEPAHTHRSQAWAALAAMGVPRIPAHH